MPEPVRMTQTKIGPWTAFQNSRTTAQTARLLKKCGRGKTFLKTIESMPRDELVKCLRESISINLKARDESENQLAERATAAFRAANVAPEDIATTLKNVFACYNPFSEKVLTQGDGLSEGQLTFYADEKVSKVNGKLWIARATIKQISVAGGFEHKGSEHDYLLFGMPCGNRLAKNENWPTLVSGEMPHILTTKLFPGGRVMFGLKEQWLVDFHRLIQKEGTVPWVPITMKVWECCETANVPGFLFPGGEELMATAEKTIKQGNGKIYVKGNKAMFVSEDKHVRLPKDFKIDGIPVKGTDDVMAVTHFSLIDEPIG